MRIFTSVLALFLLAPVANADILWDQSNFDETVLSFVDQHFSDFDDFSTYLVGDVVVSAGGWTINDVTTYFTDSSGLWGGVTLARLNIFSKTGALPVGADDPAAGIIVGVTMTDLGDTWAMNASGLDIDLAAGDYWFGLTPSAAFGDFGQEFHRPAPIIGADAAIRNPGGAFGFGTDWQDTSALDGAWIGEFDAAMLIEGVPIPAPGAILLGGLGLGAVAWLRRRIT